MALSSTAGSAAAAILGRSTLRHVAWLMLFALPSPAIAHDDPPAEPVAAPVFQPGGGSFTQAQSVVISSATDDAEIIYTLDGSEPAIGQGQALANGGSVSVTESLTLKAVARYQDTLSPVTSAAYVITGTVATPSFSPGAGTYSSPQSVTVTSATDGASLRYTTDGSAPSPDHGTALANGASVEIASDTTLRAIALRDGWEPSAVASAEYLITGKVATPGFSPGAGTYSAPQSVSVTSATDGASLRYTTDGSTPSASHGTQLANGANVEIASDTTLRAIALRDGWEPSAVASAEYLITGKVATPSFNPPAGSYEEPVQVSIASATPGAGIRYTVDGSTPAPDSGQILASGETVGIETDTTIRAIATLASWEPSDIATASYTIAKKRADKPSFEPGGGTYDAPQTVTVRSKTDGATIYYTTDGSDPGDGKGTPLSNGGTVTVAENLTLKAVAVADGYRDSNVVSASYVIDLTVERPTFSPSGGTYSEPQTVTIRSETENATIRYTTDGSTPTESHGTALANGGSIQISEDTTLKAIALRAGWKPSQVRQASYTIALEQVERPRFDPSGGTYTGAQDVTITTATPDASIRYTTDGSTPTASHGTRISSGGQVRITTTTDLKAIAYRDGWEDSRLREARYVIHAPIAFIDEQGRPLADPQTLQAGQTLTFKGSGGSGDYRVRAYANEQDVEGRLRRDDDVYTFTAPDSDAFAGDYELELRDNETGERTSLTVRVPLTMTVVPSELLGGIGQAELTITGAGRGESFTLEVLDDAGRPDGGAIAEVSSPAEARRDRSAGNPATATISAARVAARTAFRVRATSANYPDLTTERLHVVPSTTYVGLVVDPEDQGVRGATVTALGTQDEEGVPYRTETDRDGLFDLSAPMAEREDHQLGVEAAGFTARTVAGENCVNITDDTPACTVRLEYEHQAATPTFDPPPGIYEDGQQVRIATTTPDATIHYTTDGSAPSRSHGTALRDGERIPIEADTTLRAMAFKDGLQDSAVASAQYTIGAQAPAPPPALPDNPPGEAPDDAPGGTPDEGRLSSAGGGCVAGSGNRTDPTLPLAAGLAGLWLVRRRLSGPLKNSG